MKEGWEYKKLGEITIFSQGIQVDVNLQTEIYSPGKVRFLRIIDVTQGNVPPRYIDDPGERYYLKADEIAMVRYGTVGFVCYGFEGVIANNLFKVSIKDKSKLQSNYLQYYLKSDLFQSHIRKGVGGAALPAIKFGDIKNVILGFPPLSEQQSIVDYLDSAFAKIDAMKANAEKALNEAKALFQASLKEMLEPKEGWKENTLGEVCKELFSGGDAPKGNMSKEPTDDYYIPIYANAAELDGLYGYTNYYRVNEPSVTIAARGSGTGLVVKREGAYLPIVRLIVAIPKSFLSVDYLYFVLQTIRIKSNGTAIPQLTVPVIKQYRICYPSIIAEQQSIVDYLDSLKSKVDKLQENYEKVSQECDALKQAILRQVFE